MLDDVVVVDAFFLEQTLPNEQVDCFATSRTRAPAKSARRRSAARWAPCGSRTPSVRLL